MSKDTLKIGQANKLAFQAMKSKGLNTLDKTIFATETGKMLAILEQIALKYSNYNSAHIGQCLNFAFESAEDITSIKEIVSLVDKYLEITTELQEAGVAGIFKLADKDELGKALDEIRKLYK